MARAPVWRRVTAWSSLVAGVAVGGYGGKRALSEGGGWWALAGFGALSAVALLFAIWFRTRPREERERMVRAADAAANTDEVKRARTVRKELKRKRRWVGGEPREATIIALADIGRANEFTCQVYLELDVTTAAGVVRVETGESVRTAHVGILVPGRVIQVFVDPTDPTLVAVNWERSLRL